MNDDEKRAENIFNAIRGKVQFSNLINEDKEFEDLDQNRDPGSPFLYGEYMEFRLRYYAQRKDTFSIMEGVVKYMDTKISSIKNTSKFNEKMESFEKIVKSLSSEIEIIKSEMENVTDTFFSTLGELKLIIKNEEKQLEFIQEFKTDLKEQTDFLNDLKPILPYFKKEMERLSGSKTQLGKRVLSWVGILLTVFGGVYIIVKDSLNAGQTILNTTEKNIKTYVTSQIKVVQSQNETFKNKIENNIETMEERFNLRLKNKKKGVK